MNEAHLRLHLSRVEEQELHGVGGEPGSVAEEEEHDQEDGGLGVAGVALLLPLPLAPDCLRLEHGLAPLLGPTHRGQGT